MTMTKTWEKDGTAAGAGDGAGAAARLTGAAALAAGVDVAVGVAWASAIRVARRASTAASSPGGWAGYVLAYALEAVGLLRTTISVGTVITTPAPAMMIAAFRASPFMPRLTR